RIIISAISPPMDADGIISIPHRRTDEFIFPALIYPMDATGHLIFGKWILNQIRVGTERVRLLLLPFF
ncbi:MAG: hypothetical protein AAFR69_11090, partial [Pseudomonadota bacterium]